MENSSNKEELLRLLQSAKQNSSDAFDRLLSMFQPLIRSLVQEFSASADDEQDLTQEATIAFYRAIRDYKFSAESAGFARFAKICITHRLIDCQRKFASARKSEILSDDDPSDNLSDEMQNPARLVLEEENYLALCQKIRLLLSKEENEIWTLHFAGYKASEIAGMIGKNQKSVENALFRVRRKLRKAFTVRKD